jgi:tripartite-type tricarboxylate transporter receptor subunit TctC
MAFNALVAPSGVPQPVLEKLSADVRAVVNSEAFRERTKHLGINAYGNTPAELWAWMRGEIARWQQVAKAANLKAD